MTMKLSTLRYLSAVGLLFMLGLLQSGCAMCCGTYDYAYGGHGGTWQRSDLFYGRVASPFSDPQAYSRSGEMAEIIDGSEIEIIE